MGGEKTGSGFGKGRGIGSSVIARENCLEFFFLFLVFYSLIPGGFFILIIKFLFFFLHTFFSFLLSFVIPFSFFLFLFYLYYIVVFCGLDYR